MSAPREDYDPDDRMRRLIDDYPRLFKGRTPMCWSSVEPGWHSIIAQLCRDIDACLTDEQAAVFEVRQIKEKLGTLRFHMHLPGGVPEQFMELVQGAQDRAVQACRVCGGAVAERVAAIARPPETLCERHREQGK